MSENLNARNIETLAKETVRQRAEIAELLKKIDAFGNAVAVMQAELTTAKAMAANRIGSGPTA